MQFTSGIDIHQHHFPPEYVKTLNKLKIPVPLWSEKNTLKFLDRFKIETALISISSPGVYFGNKLYAAKLARICNNSAHNLIRKYPKRFGAFASLPLPDVEASIEELEYALDSLHLDGVSLLSNINGIYLGDPTHDDLFLELNQRKTIVFIHPNHPPNGSLRTKNPKSMLEFEFDTTRTVNNLIQNEVFNKFPNVKFIIAHAGGTVPYLHWKISRGEVKIIEELKNLYYDLALSANPAVFSCLKEFLTSSHMLYGSDYPFLPEALIHELIQNLSRYRGFTLKVKAKIINKNAIELFPRFKELIQIP